MRRLKIELVGNLYTAALFSRDGTLEWQTDAPTTAQAIIDELVDGRAIHPTDVRDSFNIADPAQRWHHS